QEVSRKERSLRILGKHLSGVQKERTQLEERLQRVENELREFVFTLKRVYTCGNTTRRDPQVRERLIQSRRSLSTQPQPLPLPGQHLELSAAESIMGTPELAACQVCLISFPVQVSRIDWLEQEVSAHRSHVTALRGELQDVCLRKLIVKSSDHQILSKT
uniref:Coiled-coil domain containing 171 n=1 Tax=Mastacembelus armatus TaxID=205130 RepID=A0A7N8XD19_9TELE